MGRAPLNVLCWLLAERVAQAAPQRALVVLARLSAPMGATPMLAATAARLRLGKSVPLPPWPLLPVAAEAEVVSPQLLQFLTPARVAWVTQLVLRVGKLRVARLEALAWVVTVEPTRLLPKAQEPVAVEVGLTSPTQAEQAVLAATRVAEAAVAGLRSTPWPRALAASAASGWLSSFPMQSEEQNA